MVAELPSVYLETTVPSYLVAAPSGDLVTAGHQHITCQWWSQSRAQFKCYISAYVYDELSAGDPDLAKRRIEAVSEAGVLAVSDDVLELMEVYAQELGLTGSATTDLPHFAFSVAYSVEYLLTWNCAHIANGRIIRRLGRINDRIGRPTPIILTPEELMVDSGE